MDIQTIRDIAIIAFVAFWFIVLIVLFILVLVIFKKVSGVLDSVRSTSRSVQEAVEAVSDNFVKPLAQGRGVVAFATVIDFVRGLFDRGGDAGRVEVKTGDATVRVKTDGGKAESRVEVRREDKDGKRE